MARHSFAGLAITLFTIFIPLLPIKWLATCQDFTILKPFTPQLQDQSPQLGQNIPSWPTGALTKYTPQPKNGFVTTKNGHLYLNGELFDFRSFNSPTLVPIPTVFEVVDVVRSIAGFAVPATRSYTLGVANDMWGGTQPSDHGHIIGWDAEKNDWKYNEKAWLRLDKMLAVSAEEGVKMIFPLINQDYGGENTNWVGNFNDLIRHRYNISDYKQAQLARDWFTDMPLREDLKKIIHFFLTRRNTVNGRIYGEDDTFLAIETGNEMNWAEIIYTSPGNGTTNSTAPSSTMNTTVTATNSAGTIAANGTNGTATFRLTHTRPAPANWTIDIARYIKSLAPNILVMDGSYARNKNVTEAWPVETLQSEYVDLFSYHYYGDSDLPYVSECQARVESFGKTFIVGEHGFYSNASSYRTFYETFKGAGSLIWSLRGHSEVSGFQTHSEGNNIYSLHVPGFPNQTSKNFDQLEYEIVRRTYQASLDVLGKPATSFPIPGPPYPFFATNSTHTGISFKGAAWALYYEVWGGKAGGTFTKVADNVYDNVDSGELFVAIDPSQPEEPLYVPPPSFIDDILPQTGWTDNKWFDGFFTTHTRPNWFRHRRRSISHHSKSQPRRGLDKASRRANNPSAAQGGWFSVRGISVDGKPGPFSHAAYIAVSDEL